MSTEFRTALDELSGVLAQIDDTGLDAACAMIAKAGRVMVHGCGREGLMLRGLAMRLYHLGLRASVQGEMTAPPLGPGDLLIASAGPGTLATVGALMDRARHVGARILFLTAMRDAPATALADRVLLIPAQTMATDLGGAGRSVLPMGSLYEGAMFLLFEAMILRLTDMLGETPQSLRARHTNME